MHKLNSCIPHLTSSSTFLPLPFCKDLFFHSARFSALSSFLYDEEHEPKRWNESGDNLRQKKKKENWRDPETLMRQRILLSPCLCSALLNPPPTVVFSLSLSQVSSDRWLLSSKKRANRLHPGARIHSWGRRGGENIQSFSQLEKHKWLNSKTVSLFCIGEFFISQLGVMDGNYS